MELEIVGGDDRIHGGAGDDQIIGDAGTQAGWDIDFQGGYDYLSGGAGDDIIIGDGWVQTGMVAKVTAGKDRIVGGAGADSLYGDFSHIEEGWGLDRYETASDTFVFYAGRNGSSGNDEIHDFLVGEDIIEIHGLDWSDLDTRGRNDELTGRDHAVRETATGYIIDLGRAGGEPRGFDVLTVETAGETLTIDDFAFL